MLAQAVLFVDKGNHLNAKPIFVRAKSQPTFYWKDAGEASRNLLKSCRRAKCVTSVTHTGADQTIFPLGVCKFDHDFDTVCSVS